MFKCPKCDDEFKFMPPLLRHLTEKHDITDFLKLFVDVYYDGVHPTCGCSDECNEPLTWAGWKYGFQSKYVKGHNARISNVFSDPARSKEFAAKRRAGYRSGKYVPWNKGLTKEQNLSLFNMSVQVSNTLKDKFASGERVQWNTGLTTETSPSLKQMGETFSNKVASGEIIVWNKGKTKETHPSVAKYASALQNHKANNLLSKEEFFSRVDEVSDRITLVSDPDEFETVRETLLTWKCNKCGTLRDMSLYTVFGLVNLCKVCKPPSSTAQLELFECVKTYASDAILNDRAALGGKELDVFVPSQKFAVEFNGIYYHSEIFLDANYHASKLKLATDVGIKLFSVFEDDWLSKREIIESMLVSRLGKTTTTIYARNCNVVELSTRQRREFFFRSHLDGDAQAQAAWGLIFNGEVVAALSIRRPQHKKYKDFFEVCRFASKLNTKIPGALGRLVKRASVYAIENGCHGLMTYVDLGHGDGHSYEKVGFQLVGKTAPKFWWVDDGRRVNRFKYRAQNGKSEKQVADEAGVYKIFGHGNNVYVYKH